MSKSLVSAQLFGMPEELDRFFLHPPWSVTKRTTITLHSGRSRNCKAGVRLTRPVETARASKPTVAGKAIRPHEQFSVSQVWKDSLHPVLATQIPAYAV
jgi:hypothetical protein